MNTLITHNGGQPLYFDDLVFLQDAFKDALKGLLHEFSKNKNGNIILSGCEIVGNDLTEGYVMMGYEIYYCPRLTGLDLTRGIILEATESYAPEGQKLFFDGTTKDTYKVKTAQLLTSFTPSAAVVVEDENRLTHIMPEAMKDNWAKTDFVGEKYTFQNSDLLNGASFPNSPPYVIKKNGRVQFSGSLSLPSNFGMGNYFLKIPDAFKIAPSPNWYEHVYLASYGDKFVRIGLEQDYIKLTALGTATLVNTSQLSLSQISYDINQ